MGTSKVGQLVYSLRVRAGIVTQSELVDRFKAVGVSYSRGHVGAIESGNALPGDEFVDAFELVVPGSREALTVALQHARMERSGRLGKPTKPKRSRQPFPDYLLEELRSLFAAGSFQAVIRHGKTFSRFLWVEGHVRTRTLAGEITEAAAAKVGDVEAQVSALLDDLGWSTVALGEYERARQHLSHGLDLAEQHGLPYWRAKGWRHLAGLEVELQSYPTALENLEKARSAAQEISEELLRAEMAAGIAYGLAITHFANGSFDLAEQALDESQYLRGTVGDFSRAVKIHALKGKIYERQHRTGLAIDAYRRGLDESVAVGRRDEQIRNLFGLARTLPSIGRDREANAYLSQAQEMMKETPVPYEIVSDPSRLE